MWGPQLDMGFWVLCVGFSVIYGGFWVVHMGFWVLCMGFSVIYGGFWVVHMGFWVLDLGLWVVDVGFCVVYGVPGAAVWGSPPISSPTPP